MKNVFIVLLLTSTLLQGMGGQQSSKKCQCLHKTTVNLHKEKRLVHDLVSASYAAFFILQKRHSVYEVDEKLKTPLEYAIENKDDFPITHKIMQLGKIKEDIEQEDPLGNLPDAGTRQRYLATIKALERYVSLLLSMLYLTIPQ